MNFSNFITSNQIGDWIGFCAYIFGLGFHLCTIIPIYNIK